MADKVAKLHLYVDVDVKKLGLDELMDGSVGHTWVALEWNDPTKVPDDIHASHKGKLQAGGKYADPMGFWPDIGGVHGDPTGYSANPFKSYVQGEMKHPDREHEGREKASQTWDLTRGQVDAAIKYAEGKRGAKYSVYFYNCTTFGKEIAKAAGQSPPSMSSGGICFPNAAYDGIKKRQKKAQGNTMVEDLDSGKQTTVDGGEGSKKR